MGVGLDSVSELEPEEGEGEEARCGGLCRVKLPKMSRPEEVLRGAEVEVEVDWSESESEVEPSSSSPSSSSTFLFLLLLLLSTSSTSSPSSPPATTSAYPTTFTLPIPPFPPTFLTCPGANANSHMKSPVSSALLFTASCLLLSSSASAAFSAAWSRLACFDADEARSFVVEWEGEEPVVVVIPVRVVRVGVEVEGAPGDEEDLERAVAVARCMNCE